MRPGGAQGSCTAESRVLHLVQKFNGVLETIVTLATRHFRGDIHRVESSPTNKTRNNKNRDRTTSNTRDAALIVSNIRYSLSPSLALPFSLSLFLSLLNLLMLKSNVEISCS